MAERLKTLRGLLPGTPSARAFAIRWRINVQSYHNYERRGSIPSPETFRRIQEVSGCNLLWLMFGQGSPFGSYAAGVAEADAEYQRDRWRIPILAVGSAAEPERVAWSDFEELGHDELPDDLHEIRVVGDSMAPVVLHGQHVLCTHGEPQNGDLAAIELKEDDEVLFKRVHFAGTRIILDSVNPDPRYAPWIVKRRQIRRMRKIWGAKY